MKTPIIGIVSKNWVDRTGDGSNQFEMQFVWISELIKDAVIDNGGVPIALLPSDKGVHDWKKEKDYKLSKHDQNILIKQIKLCDGIIIQGYKTGFWHERFVVRYCYDNDIPLLGICNGHTNICLEFGARQIKTDNAKHLRAWDEISHNIFINPSTKFFKIIGKEKIGVNSLHQNHIDSVPNNLICSAVDDDGNPEVVEGKDKRFFIGMKFHPESLQFDLNHKKIFASFVKACANPRI